jgi:type II secretory pathway component PulF
MALAVALCLVTVLVIFGLLYLIYYHLTLPMRRNERARMTLDLLELGLKDGRTPEVALIWAASSGDRSLGRQFGRVVWCLERGQRLSEALRHAPRLLPPQVSGVLRAGERLGDIARVIPACRYMLRDGVSQVRGALNYVVFVTLILSPAALLMPFGIQLFILPKMKEVFAGLSDQPLPWMFELWTNPGIPLIQAGLICAFWVAVLAYIGGPRLRSWVRKVAPQSLDHLLWLLPWRRKRLQRDFSAMLAVLLDAGVPETESVQMAAEATDNQTLLSRAQKVRGLLSTGVKLPEALRVIDRSGEFRWRLSNALRQSGGFLHALNGWHEALDAKAFQQEQTAAQVTTTLLVIFNGLIVGAVFISIFLVLIGILDNSAPW